jgi:integrase/recombinase XerD
MSEHKNNLSISEIDIQDLKEFINFIVGLDLGPYTQSRVISSVKAFYKYLVLEKIITENPSELLESPRLGRKLPDVLTVEEVEDIINSVDLSKVEGERNKAIIETLYGCGLRVSELINLKISSINFKENIILVTGKGNKQRLIPIGEPTKKQIKTYLIHTRLTLPISKNDSDIVFLNRRGAKLSRQMVFYIVKKQVEITGIKKNISPHSFRHSFATHLVQNGADLRAVQELLGHVSIITTEIYTHLNSDDLRKAIIDFHPRNKDNKEF